MSDVNNEPLGIGRIETRELDMAEALRRLSAERLPESGCVLLPIRRAPD